MRLVLPTGNTADVYIDDKLVQNIDMTVDDTYEFNTDREATLLWLNLGRSVSVMRTARIRCV